MVPNNLGDAVTFMTVHRAKGLEADHVVVASMTSENRGFPSRIEDDQVLQLALPAREPYPYAEERRLFYVAVTRARKTVTLLTELERESSFVTELVKTHKVPVKRIDGESTSFEVCGRCGTGILRERKGRYGPFIGCSNFPDCNFTRKA